MSNDSKNCDCLYRALCTDGAGYNKEEARKKYVELSRKTSKLPIQVQSHVTNLLNTAKRILGNIGLERVYFENGKIDNEKHNCDEAREALMIIQAMDTETGEQQDEIEDNTTSRNINEERNLRLVEVDRIIGHRFRKRQLKLNIIIQPGAIQLVENEERVTQLAELKVIEYLNELKHTRPRRLSHILKLRPDLIRLFNSNK